jgi:hypothetical protein
MLTVAGASDLPYSNAPRRVRTIARPRAVIAHHLNAACAPTCVLLFVRETGSSVMRPRCRFCLTMGLTSTPA